MKERCENTVDLERGLTDRELEGLTFEERCERMPGYRERLEACLSGLNSCPAGFRCPRPILCARRKQCSST